MGALVMTWVEAVEGDYVLRIPLSPVKHLDEWSKTSLLCFFKGPTKLNMSKQAEQFVKLEQCSL